MAILSILIFRGSFSTSVRMELGRMCSVPWPDVTVGMIIIITPKDSTLGKPQRYCNLLRLDWTVCIEKDSLSGS